MYCEHGPFIPADLQCAAYFFINLLEHGQAAILISKSVVDVSGFLMAGYAAPLYSGILQEVFFMKNTIKILGIIAIVAIIGFSVAACGGTSSPANPPTGNGPSGPDNGLPGNGPSGPDNGLPSNGPSGPDNGLPGNGQPALGCGCDGYFDFLGGGPISCGDHLHTRYLYTDCDCVSCSCGCNCYISDGYCDCAGWDWGECYCNRGTYCHGCGRTQAFYPDYCTCYWVGEKLCGIACACYGLPGAGVHGGGVHAGGGGGIGGFHATGLFVYLR